jgi:alpha/beta superfamily hydrolase
MVLKGQFLERPTLIPVGDLVLEGLSHRGEKGALPLLIVPPPAAEGGSMDHVVAAEVAWAAAMAGFPTLRFNFRGVGGSQGQRGAAPDLLQDAEAALQLACENAGAAELAVVTIGGSAALGLELRERHPSICALALVSPLGITPEALSALALPLAVVVAERDERLPRAALAAATTQAGGRLAVIEQADAAFNRHLSQVGKVVVHLLKRISPLPTTDL